MNKTETLMVVLLFGSLLAWMTLVKPKQVEQAAAAAAAAASNQVSSVVEQVPGPAGEPTLTEAGSPVQIEPPPAPVAVPPRKRAPEQTAVVSNDEVVVTFTTWGGGIKQVELLEHDQSVSNRDAHVVLDFSDGAALSLSGLAALPDGGEFELVGQEGKTVRFKGAIDGVSLVRELTLLEGYEISLSDPHAGYWADADAQLGSDELALRLSGCGHHEFGRETCT
jgi:YidC/Oxa1 family membrane protein insertase